MKSSFLVLLSILIFTVVPISANAKQANVSFQDITAQSGINVHGATHGAFWADADADGFPDLYLPQQEKHRSLSDLFFRNQGNGSFSQSAAQRRINDPDGGSHGATWVDLDNDGDYDLINGSTKDWSNKPTPNDIYRNQNGWFDNVTPATLTQNAQFTRAIIAFDMNKDGRQDILAISGPEGSTESDQNELYRNLGDFSFQTETWSKAVTADAGQSALASDIDGDGDIDLLLANRTGRISYLRNGGWGNFTTVDPFWFGLTHDWFEGGDGINSADIDNDGDPDLLLTSDDSAQLFINNGWGQFWLKTRWKNSQGYMGGFADLDNDGDQDLIFAGQNQAHLNDGNGNFTESAWLPIPQMSDPRAIAFADIDNNGTQDFFVTDNNGLSRLIKTNNWSGNHWLKVDLISPSGERGALGAKVTVYPHKNRWQQIGWQEAISNRGYLAQNDPVLHFGLAEHSLVDIKVRYLNGQTVWRTGIPANQTILIDGRNP